MPPTTATTTPTTIRAYVPHRVEAHKSWAKAVQEVDPAQRHGFALVGQWLERGADYLLPAGTVVVTVDAAHHPDRGQDRVRLVLWRADTDAEDGLALLGEKAKWGHIGQAMLTMVAKALSATPPVRPLPAAVELFQLSPTPPRPNQRDERCHQCRQVVPARSGHLFNRDGRWLVQHPDRCPDRPNSHPGRCHRCGQHVGAYCGLLATRSDGTRRVAHQDECPPPPSGPPANNEPGPCAVCWQQVPSRKGTVVGPLGAQQPLHEPTCPPNPYNPHGAETWLVRERAPQPQTGYDYPIGTVARVATDTPVTGPGARELLGGGQSLIGVVTAVVARHRTQDTYGRSVTERVMLWRPATEAEAEPVLHAELRLLVESGLLAQARPLVSLLPGAPVSGAAAPTSQELADALLWTLPRVFLPSGAGRAETALLVDEPGEAVWTLVHNSARGDDWALNNFGGYIAYHHPLTPERAELIDDLRAHPVPTI